MLLNPHKRKRTFQAYCIGLPKTGTTSITNIFGNYRSIHGFLLPEILRILTARNEEKISKKEIANFLRARDERGWLEMDSSGLNFFFLEYLARQFPSAKFIFTIRDCYSWCDSMLNNALKYFSDPLGYSELIDCYSWCDPMLLPYFTATDNYNSMEYRLTPRLWEHFRYSIGFDYKIFKDEQTLIDNIGAALDRLLPFWSKNEDIFRKCPPERTLIIRTCDITSSLPLIANFLGIGPKTLISNEAHSKKQSHKHHILKKVDLNFLESRFKECSSSFVMSRYFPNITLTSFLHDSGKANLESSQSHSSARSRIAPAVHNAKSFYPPRFWIRQAEVATSLGQKSLALKHLTIIKNLALEIDELPRVARLYASLEEYKEALKVLTKFQKNSLKYLKNPPKGKTLIRCSNYMWRGIFLLESGDYLAAKRYLNKAANLNTKKFKFELLPLAICKITLGLLTEALSDLNKYIQACPNPEHIEPAQKLRTMVIERTIDTASNIPLAKTQTCDVLSLRSSKTT